MTNRRVAAPPLFVADDKFADVIAELEGRGWRRFPHPAFPGFALKWSNYAKIQWPRVGPTQIVNHLQHATRFSRKDWLAARLHGHRGQRGVHGFFPRTFDVGSGEPDPSLRAWAYYCRAIGILKAVIDSTNSSDGHRGLRQQQQQQTQRPSAASVDAAVAFVALALGQSADDAAALLAALGPVACQSNSPPALNLDDPRWLALTDHDGKDSDRCDATPPLLSEIRDLLAQARARDPQYDAIAPGRGDVWICKPCNLSQGRGIHVVDSLDAIRALTAVAVGDLEAGVHAADVEDDDPDERASRTRALEPLPPPSPTTTTMWVVQKYIERPLLLQGGHKFDVRQWALITSVEPLRVYWYDRCYLRFCSQRFTLDHTTLSDRFTHLSNYSVQKDAHTVLASAAPDPMWDSERFRRELEQQHGRDVWGETLVPQMQSAALATIESVRPELNRVGRGFEWLGIDFLIDADLRVWLLEVNVSPDVSHSTDVTAVMVPAATRDALDLILSPTSAPPPERVGGWVALPTATEQ